MESKRTWYWRERASRISSRIAGSSGAPERRFHGAVSLGSSTRPSYMRRGRGPHLRPFKICSKRSSAPRTQPSCTASQEPGSSSIRRSAENDASDEMGSAAGASNRLLWDGCISWNYKAKASSPPMGIQAEGLPCDAPSANVQNTTPVSIPDDGAKRLSIEHLSLRFGGVYALSEVALHVGPGELVAIIGPNGAGKTSLVNCISGVYRPSEGHVRLEGRGLNRRRPPPRTRPGPAPPFRHSA